MKWFLTLMLICVLLLAAGCNLPTAPTQPNPGLEQTQAMETIQAMLTQDALKSTPTVESLTATNTPLSSTVTTPATNTSSPAASATITPIPCDKADFIADVTIPDGTSFAGGAKFIKTWRLKNTGVCTWTTSYQVVFTGGNSMGSPAAVNLSTNVPPDQTIDISLELTAPAELGSYRGNFKLRNPTGKEFGTGSSGTAVFYVDIRVSAPVSIDSGYSFVDNYCSAEWSSAAGTLTCTEKDGNANGFVLRDSAPHLETGQIDDESALIMSPHQTNDGVIRGKYPQMLIKNGDVFRTIVGCEHRASNCNVKFQLDYQIDNAATQTLASWDEAYNEAFTIVNQDLSALAGKNVRFILTVFANGSASGDRAVWLKPRLERITPTATP